MGQRDRKIFIRRTSNSFRSHRRRALEHRQALDYDLDRLRQLVAAALGNGICTYCRRTITPRNFSLDHIEPTSRGGSYHLHNLAVSCQGCNAAKGPLTALEYGQLLDLLAGWPKEIAGNTLARLKAGATFARNIAGRNERARATHPRSDGSAT